MTSLQIYCRVYQWKNFENRLRFDKVIDISWLPRFLMKHSILCNGRPSPSKQPLPMGRSGSPSNSWFLGLIRANNPNGISTSSAIFAQITAECPHTLQWVAPFPLKIAPSHRGILTPSNIWFPWPTRVLNPNTISIGSAIFAGLSSVIDWPTDRPRYSVTNNRPHLRT